MFLDKIDATETASTSWTPSHWKISCPNGEAPDESDNLWIIRSIIFCNIHGVRSEFVVLKKNVGKISVSPVLVLYSSIWHGLWVPYPLHGLVQSDILYDHSETTETWIGESKELLWGRVDWIYLKKTSGKKKSWRFLGATPGLYDTLWHQPEQCHIVRATPENDHTFAIVSSSRRKIPPKKNDLPWN